MNADRRKRIKAAKAALEEAAASIANFQTALEEAKSAAEEAYSTLETCRDEEQEYYDNMPESIQGSEKGENAQAAVEALESLMSSVEDITSAEVDTASIEEFAEFLDTAINEDWDTATA